MKYLSRYVGKQVLLAILVVLLIVVALDAIGGLIDQLGDLRGDYNIFAAMVYIGLTIPASLDDYLPMAVLVGSLFALGNLSGASELVVMRSSGVATTRIVEFACKPVIVLVFLTMAVSQYVVPVTEQWAKSYRDFAIWGGERSLSPRGGVWHREGEQFIHIAVVQPGGVLYGISLFEFAGENALSRTLIAERATYNRDQWLLENVRETHFEGSATRVEEVISQVWRSGLSPGLLRYVTMSADDLSLVGLLEYTQHLDSQELDSGIYRLAFWQAVMQPVVTLSLLLLATAFIFGPLRSATGGFRIFVGVIVGIVFQFAQQLIGPASLLYGFPPLAAVLSPVIVIATAGFWLHARAR